MVLSPAAPPPERSAAFLRNISARSAYCLQGPPRKEHFNAARESLLGMRQTDNCGERVVFMVRTAQEIVLG
jgi:hypothetical protein